MTTKADLPHLVGVEASTCGDSNDSGIDFPFDSPPAGPHESPPFVLALGLVRTFRLARAGQCTDRSLAAISRLPIRAPQIRPKDQDGYSHPNLPLRATFGRLNIVLVPGIAYEWHHRSPPWFSILRHEPVRNREPQILPWAASIHAVYSRADGEYIEEVSLGWRLWVHVGNGEGS